MNTTTATIAETAQSMPAKGLLFSLSGTIILSTNYITAKYGLTGFRPESFCLIWSISAAFFSLVIIFITGQQRRLKVPKSAALKLFLIGLANGIGILLGWAGLARLDPAFSSFLWRFLPMLGILFGFMFLKERFSRGEIFPVALMISGGFVSAFGRWEHVGTGIVLTLLSCCAAAIQMGLAKVVVKDVGSTIIPFYRALTGIFIVSIWLLLTDSANFDVPASYWGVTILGAFLGPCLSLILIYRSYTYWELSRSSAILTIEPLMVIPQAYVLLGKFPATQELIGGSIILFGAVWLTLLHQRQAAAN
ncbi:DMT family transporter [candidate division KSB1 bacterium]|nr:DMT family transporter [candidate division KSB1 bacterium]